MNVLFDRGCALPACNAQHVGSCLLYAIHKQLLGEPRVNKCQGEKEIPINLGKNTLRKYVAKMTVRRKIPHLRSCHRFTRMLPLLFLLGLTNSGASGWQKFPSRFPLTGIFTHVPRSNTLVAPILGIHHSVLSGQNATTWLQSHSASNANNPAFQLNHHKAEAFSRLRKRAANDDEALNHETNPPRSSNAGLGGVQGSTGLSEMEIAIIVVCSALGLLTCIIGLIFLARYYWKKFHGDSLGYQGVLQRDSSESSMGTTRVDVKEAMARFEETGTSNNPSLLHPSDALLIKHHICEQSAEKEPLLPCANGAAITDRQEISTINSTNKAAVNEVEGRNESDKNKTASSIILPQELPSRTGLSQSDCSISSYTSVNPSYKYGNQVGYMSGYYGYPCDTTFDDTGNVALKENICRVQRSSLPIVTFRPSTSDEEASKHFETQATIEDDDDEFVQDVFGDAQPIQTDEIEDEQDIVDSENSNSLHLRENCNLSANNSLLNLQTVDLDAPNVCRLTGSNRALSLPESFGPEKGSGDNDEVTVDQDANRPTDSGWGDTVKGHFRGSLPVLHLSVSPEEARAKTASIIESTIAYPTDEELTPNDVEKRPLLQTTLPATLMLPNTFGNTRVINDDEITS